MELDVLVLRTHNCSSCGQVLRVLGDIKREKFPNMRIEEADIIEHPELLEKYPILASPGVVVNGQLVAHGIVTRKKLEQRIQDVLEGEV